MQTVQFQCGHCGKLMGVGSAHLGQQVRCPHCQQVVVAPSSAAPPELAETIPSPAAGEAEDIFAPPEASDDLFGRSETPRIEMPPEPQPPTFPNDHTIPVPQEGTAPPAFFPNQGGEGTVPTTSATPSWMTDGVTETLPPPPAVEMPLPVQESSAPPARLPRRTEPKAPWFLLLVFCPLLLYSLVISVFAWRLYDQWKLLLEQQRKPFEMMPDEGDKPGVQKGKQVKMWKYESKLATLPLPDNLCTWLDKHQPLQVGDLQITPQRVERRRVRVIEAGRNAEPCQGDSLVLYLELKNLSSEYAFAPLDNYFDRSWRSGSLPPLTLLEVGDKHRFYGGPADWCPRGDPKHRRQWIEGRKDEPEVLQPGEQKEMFVCTNGDDDRAVAVLFGKDGQTPYHGSFLWRVRLRRGLVHFDDKTYPATAVIGVRFRDGDIDKNAPEIQ